MCEHCCSLNLVSLSYIHCTVSDDCNNACQAGKWNQNFALLHVYNGNSAAIDLYRSCGFEELKRDPEWQQLLGRRQRILFAKGATAASSGSALQSISNSVMRIFQQTSQ